MLDSFFSRFSSEGLRFEWQNGSKCICHGPHHRRRQGQDSNSNSDNSDNHDNHDDDSKNKTETKTKKTKSNDNFKKLSTPVDTRRVYTASASGYVRDPAAPFPGLRLLLLIQGRRRRLKIEIAWCTVAIRLAAAYSSSSRTSAIAVPFGPSPATSAVSPAEETQPDRYDAAASSRGPSSKPLRFRFYEAGHIINTRE